MGRFFFTFLTRSCFCVPGADLLKLTREDVIQICGPADGIRLFNALKGRWVFFNWIPSYNTHLVYQERLHTFTDMLLFALCGCCLQGGTPEADHLRLSGVSAGTGAATEAWKRRCCRQHVLWSVCVHGSCMFAVMQEIALAFNFTALSSHQLTKEQCFQYSYVFTWIFCCWHLK